MISGLGTISTAVEAMQLGAISFLEKPFGATQFLELVTTSLELATLRSKCDDEAADFAQLVESLTAREKQVLYMVADGQLTKNIARTLGISTKTVDVHRSNITKKLKVHSVAQLVKLVTEYRERAIRRVPQMSPIGTTEAVSTP